MKNRIFAIILIITLAFTVSACNKASDNSGGNEQDESNEVTYPLVSYLPHNGGYIDDRWVSVRYSTPEELAEAVELLRENGVEIPEKKRVAFDFVSDKYVVKYWFDGIITYDSAKQTADKDYYELDYEMATLEAYLYYNASSKSEIPGTDKNTHFITGPHSMTHPTGMYGYAFARMSAPQGAEIPDDIDVSKLTLGKSEYIDYVDYPGGYYETYVSYNGTDIMKIESVSEITAELFAEMKSTFIVY